VHNNIQDTNSIVPAYAVHKQTLTFVPVFKKSTQNNSDFSHVFLTGPGRIGGWSK